MRALTLFFVSVVGVLNASEVAADVKAIQKMVAWRVSEQGGTGGPKAMPEQVCGINKLEDFQIQRMDLDIATTVSDADANSQVEALDRKVIEFLQEKNWTASDMGKKTSGIPDLKRCYSKDGAVAQIYQTTGRCTMGAKCKVFDGFAVVLYSPKGKK